MALLLVCHAVSELDDGDGDEIFEFDSLLDSSGNFTISMTLTTLLFFVLKFDRLADSPSSLVSVIDSDGGIRHEFSND